VADLNRLIEKLLSSDIDFVLVGGYAGVLYGVTQVTRDIDICMDLSPVTIQKLRQVLADIHPMFRPARRGLSFLEHPSDLMNVKNLYLQTDLGPLDILSEISGVGSFTIVKSRASSVPLFGRTCSVMGIDHLIASKTAMGRDKDRAVVLELQLIRNRK
jgi:hypothetical protein